jgi:hypothetical protein
MEEASAAEQIILIHGTGAGDIADRGKRWWQLESSFQLSLQSLLKDYVFGKPFHWLGANLENERNEAARVLLDRLRALDLNGSRYHLVAHSHGGSVLWHCLVASAKEGNQLRGLKSWTTIGTPFLLFRAIPSNLWLILASLLALGFFAISLFPDRPGTLLAAIQRLHQSAQTFSVIVYGFLLASLGILAGFVAILVLQPVIASLRERKDVDAALRAKDWYGTSWLGLWHPLDEPINLLAGTLGSAPTIAPRLSSTSLLRFVPFIAPIYDNLFARAADEFVWQKIIQRAQGSNIVGKQAVAVERAPFVLTPGWGPLPSAIADAITKRCNLRAGETVDRMRATFEGAYDAQDSSVIFRTLARTVTFHELIHTSYYDDADVQAMVAKWIQMKSGGTETFLSDGNVFPLGPPLGPPSPGFMKRERQRLSKVDLVLALGLIATSGLLATATLSYYDAKIAPATDRYQLESIANAMRRPAINSVGTEDALPAVLMRLEVLGLTPRSEDLLENIGDANARQSAARGIGYALGYAGEFSRVDPIALRFPDVSLGILAVKSEAVEGAIAAERTPPVELIDELRAQFVRKASGSAMRTVADALIAFYSRSTDRVELIGKLIDDRNSSTLLSAPIVKPVDPAVDVTDDCYFSFVVAQTRYLKPDERYSLGHKINCTQRNEQLFTGTFLRALVDNPDDATIRAVLKGGPLENASIKEFLLSALKTDDIKLSENTTLQVMYAIEIQKAFNRFTIANLNEAYDAATSDRGLRYVLHLMSDVAEKLNQQGDAETTNKLYERIERDLPQLYAEQAQSFKNELFEEDTMATFRNLIVHLNRTKKFDNAAWWTRETYSILLDRKDNDQHLRPLWYAAVAQAAQTLNLGALARQAIRAGLALTEPTPNELDLRGAIELGLVSKALAGSDAAETAKAAYEKATDWMNRVSDRDGLEIDLVKLVSAWSAAGDLPRAREIADHAPTKRATLGGYVAILDEAIKTHEASAFKEPAFEPVGRRYLLAKVISDW